MENENSFIIQTPIKVQTRSKTRKQKYVSDNKQTTIKHYLSPHNLNNHDKNYVINSFNSPKVSNSPKIFNSPIAKENNSLYKDKYEIMNPLESDKVKPRRARIKKSEDANQAKITTFFLTPKREEAQKLSNESENFEDEKKDVMLSVLELKKKWAESDEKLENLKAIQVIAKKWENLYQTHEEEMKQEENERLAKLERFKNIDIKNCKHLTLDNLDQLVDENFKWLDNTLQGHRYCKRHELYYKGISGLFYNDSCSVFDTSQIRHIISLFRKNFDDGDFKKYSNYYWAVLLPEFTLKIFMDMYDMSEKDAMEYLKFYPDTDDDDLDFNI